MANRIEIEVRKFLARTPEIKREQVFAAVDQVRKMLEAVKSGGKAENLNLTPEVKEVLVAIDNRLISFTNQLTARLVDIFQRQIISEIIRINEILAQGELNPEMKDSIIEAIKQAKDRL